MDHYDSYESHTDWGRAYLDALAHRMNVASDNDSYTTEVDGFIQLGDSHYVQTWYGGRSFGWRLDGTGHRDEYDRRHFASFPLYVRYWLRLYPPSWGR